MNPHPDIIVFSHLRWDWVYQRPQHLLSRLATNRRVVFIEEPLHIEDGRQAYWKRTNPEPNVTVYNPYTPVPDRGFDDHQMPTLQRLVAELLESEKLTDYVAWFYTPMALPLLQQLKPLAVIYDCMDELSGFKNAPPQIVERESELFGAADVIFTGGPSLYRAKKDRHCNVHCFSSSVDAEHFGKARNKELEAPVQAALPGPKLGFFGVIDERLDLDIIGALATAHPEWQIVMVGPVVKIDPATLPRQENIHYLGQQSYAALPSYLAGWDVCMLPFARNSATRFISPTKTLEYMAAEKPIVSTPITDVAEPYGDIVLLGDTPEAFIKACETALAEDENGRQTRIEAMRGVLARTSWDRTAQVMADEITKVASRVRRPRPVSSRQSVKPKSEHWPVVVIGAGPTGLSAAYHMGPDALLLERADHVGGWCSSIYQNGFTWDYAGHIMFSNDEYVHKLYNMLLGDNVHWQDREAWIYSKNVHTRYPFQGSLHGLPPKVIKECLIGAIEARFGNLKGNLADEMQKQMEDLAAAEQQALQANREAHRCQKNDLHDCCGDGILESTPRLTWSGNGESRLAKRTNGGSKKEPKKSGAPEASNFEEFIYKVWGAGIAKHFAIPYNKKLWTVPLSEMETSWLGGRVPMPDLEEMIDGALQPAPKPMGPNARFGYPLRGGFQALMNGFLPHIKDRLRYNSEVIGISPARHTITLQNGSVIEYDHLISTMPLPVLIRNMDEEAPSRLSEAASELRYVSVRCVHLGVGRENLTEKHWIYYPEDSVFHRIFVQGNASPYCNAPGGFGLTCEITYSPYKPLPCDGDELIQRCIRDCHKVGMFAPDDPVWAATQVDLPHAYVIYDHARARNVKLIREWLLKQDILLAGRYSEWEYYNSDNAFIAGKKAADNVQALRNRHSAALAG